MSEAAIRAAIKTILEGVDGIGVVHDRRRYSRSLATWLGLMRQTADGPVNGWVIHRHRTTNTRKESVIDRTHHYMISGVYQLDDENDSSATIQALAEAIFTAFKDDHTLGDTVLDAGPLVVEEIDDITISETLTLHTVEMSLTAWERAYYS